MTACSWASCGNCGRCTAAWDDPEAPEPDDDLTPEDQYEDELAMREDYDREDR